MKITLDSNPSDAPCCLKITAENGQYLLVQTDWDWPGIASTFGWSIESVQNAKRDGDFDWTAECGIKVCQSCKQAYYPMELENNRCECGARCYTFTTCDHSGSDGTVDCKECGCKASQFIQAARQWLDDNDGAQAEDPGYFGN